MISRLPYPLAGLRSRALIVLVPFLLLACKSPVKSEVKPADPGSRIFPAAPAPSREANDVGRFVAGLPSDSGSPFASLEQQEAWKMHSAELDRTWRETDAQPLSGMREFQGRNLNDAEAAAAPVFYPFSGPDALMVTTFYPHNPTYVLIGLEPPGTLPTAAQIESKGLPVVLAGLRETVYSVLHRSFFVTREMDRQLRGQVTNGILPPLLHLLVRSNHTITGFRYVRINDEGVVIESNADPTGSYTNKGIEVDFTSAGSTALQRLFYFSVNLSDDKLRSNKAVNAFLANYRDTATYMKATSYMPHHPEFSIIRESIIAHSRLLLQDDSGIPYRFLASGPWTVSLFGDYNKPMRTFRWLEQPDLRNAYNTGNRQKLGFQIGYGYSRMPSNLLLARRHAAPATLAATAIPRP